MRKTLVKGSKEAKAFMAKLRAKKGVVKKTIKRVVKNAKQSFKDGYYAKDKIGASKYNSIKKVDNFLIGYESNLKRDVRIAIIDEKNKIVRPTHGYFPKHPMSKKAINWAKRNGYIYMVDGKKVGSTLLIEKGESTRKKPTRIVQVNRTKAGTFKKFSKVSGVKKHTDTKSHNVNIKVGSVYQNSMPTGKKMYAQINEFAYVYAGISGGNLREYLKSNTNKWVEIDTNYLFDDQYNTVDGFRIYDTMISAIKNDARIGIKQFENSTECCFLKWNGIKPYPRPLPKDLPTTIAKPNPQFKNEYLIGTYRLNIINQHYCLANGRQSIKFLFHDGDYYLTTGIGYRMRVNLSGGYPVSYPIPTDVKKKLFKIMNSI